MPDTSSLWEQYQLSEFLEQGVGIGACSVSQHFPGTVHSLREQNWHPQMVDLFLSWFSSSGDFSFVFFTWASVGSVQLFPCLSFVFF